LGYAVCTEVALGLQVIGIKIAPSRGATNIFRREDCRWKMVRPHRDLGPPPQCLTVSRAK
jgi:hypothetical protein